MGTACLDAPGDVDLVHAARAGDAGALGALLARHRPALLAVAVSLLGHGPEAEDAVQEASLIALGRIGDLRDPAAAGAWLRTVVRNVCRRQYLSPAELPLGDGLAAALRSPEPDPAQLLERQATRDWVWHAVEELSPPLRLAVMLRYFSGVTAYQDIADACGVPVGTVRSRLNEARGRLARALLATADAEHGDARALTEAQRRHAEELVAAARRGELASAFAASFSPTVEVSAPHGFQAQGYGRFVRRLEQDQEDGVGIRLINVVASWDLAVWEFEMLNPPGDPHHCPPGTGWVLHLRSGWVERARLFHLRRPFPDRARARAA
jgi:RNA polymerase sigma factor (sigma-70 family)